MQIIRLITLLIALLPITSKAAIMIEPYVGYSTINYSGSLKLSGTKADIDSTTMSGMTYGGRLGAHFLNVGAGLDYSQASYNDPSRVQHIGAYGMVSFFFFRLWGTYIASSSRTFEDSSNNINNTAKGSGFKAGLGWSILPLLSLNFEYLSLHYTKEDNSNITDFDEKDTGMLVSLSMPLSF